MAKINWSEARAKYISDETISYNDIAKEYGVVYKTVAVWAKKQNWIKLRKESALNGNQKVIEKVGDSIAEVNARHIRTGKLFQEAGINPVKNKRFKPRSFDQALRSVDKGIEMERKALGIDKPATPLGPTQPNTIINYFDFKNKYAHRRGNDQLPSSN